MSRAQTETRPTPLPWEADEFRPCDWRIKSPDGDGGCWWVAEMSSDSETARANADLIVRAVNNHADLLEALRDAEALLSWARSYLADPQSPQPKSFNEVITRARAVLAAADKP